MWMSIRFKRLRRLLAARLVLVDSFRRSDGAHRALSDELKLISLRRFTISVALRGTPSRVSGLISTMRTSRWRSRDHGKIAGFPIIAAVPIRIAVDDGAWKRYGRQAERAAAVDAPSRGSRRRGSAVRTLVAETKSFTPVQARTLSTSRKAFEDLADRWNFPG